MKNNILISFILVCTNLFGSVEDHLLLIRSSIEAGEYLIAEVNCETAISEYDANAALYFVRAQVAVKLDKLDDANKYFIKAIELDDKNENYRLEQEALSELRNALTSAKKTLDSGDYNRAVLEYTELTEKYPEHAIIFYNLGQVHKLNEDYDSAYDNFYEAAKLNIYKEDYNRAINEIAQRVAKIGNTEYRRKEYEAAIKYFNKAVHFSPNFTSAYFKLAHSYYKVKDYDNARIILEKNLSIDPNQAQSEKLLGDIYKKVGNNEEAVNRYNKATVINKNYYQAFYSMGALYLTMDELTQARESLNKSLLIEPGYTKAYATLGTVEQNFGNFDNAIQNYIKALDLDSRLYDVYFRLSRVYNIKAEHENAKISAKESLKIKHNYAPAFFELGLAEMNLCNIVAAKDAFEKAKRDRNFRQSSDSYLKNIDYYTKDCN